ncbi:MAG: 23S rRNA (cytosine1962-C5)-methyltransferase, partial [Bradymonadia bacterium]
SATTCYRTCNGAADGHDGWIVDRYGDWGWVQAAAGSDGPLPEGLRGVYRVDAGADRSQGQQTGPQLVDGEAAPADLPVIEAGVNHLALLGPQLSTGLFLDQRPQRAWLRKNAAGMRILNTFAHAGGFSVAAACAGAETVSIDLSRTWLERIPPALVANGIDPAGHDRIYGDVFDWIRRLRKRGEQFDLVILDPPSTSVGKKKKRWSAANDYPELVRLAAPLVRPGGMLWAATNHRRISPGKLVHLVSSAVPEGVVLERVCPPAVDFPTDGPAAVKTHVWRWPA